MIICFNVTYVNFYKQYCNTKHSFHCFLIVLKILKAMFLDASCLIKLLSIRNFFQKSSTVNKLSYKTYFVSASHRLKSSTIQTKNTIIESNEINHTRNFILVLKSLKSVKRFVEGGGWLDTVRERKYWGSIYLFRFERYPATKPVNHFAKICI